MSPTGRLTGLAAPCVRRADARKRHERARDATSYGGEAERPGSEGVKQWLLFAGSEPQATTDVPVAIFREEIQARRAFLNVRLRSTDPGAWAQLVAVDATGRTRPACWFGQVPIVGDDRTVAEWSSTSPPADGPKSRGWSGFVAAVAIVVAAVVAVAAGTWLIAHDDAGSGRRAIAPRPTPSPERPAGVLVGYEATRTTQESYFPGESRQWHPADGLHQVTVHLGTLRVEHAAGHGVDYAAGATYVAG